MSQENFKQTDLETFKWDEAVPEIDFFGEVTKNPSKEDKSSDIQEDEKEITQEPVKGKEKTEKVDDNVFADFETTSTEEEKEDKSDKIKSKETTQDNGKISNISVANFLKEKGLIDFEVNEGEELDEIDAEALIEDAYEESVERRLEETIAELPESVKNLVKFAAKGGDVDDYLSNIGKASSEGISKSLDITKEDNQLKIMKHQLKKDGYDDEYIDAQLDFLKDSGKLESISKGIFTKWKKEQDEKDSKLVEQQQETIRQAKQAQINYKREISKHLSEVDNIKNLKFTKQDTRELPEYISNSTVELEDGRRVSPFHKDLFEAMKDKNKVLLLAKFVKNDFDFKDIEKTVATKQAQKVKEDLQRQKETTKINSAVGSSQSKRLADYFND